MSLGWLGWKLRMRAVEVMAAAWERFRGVLEGVGSMVMGSMVEGRSEFEGGPSESEWEVLRE